MNEKEFNEYIEKSKNLWSSDLKVALEYVNKAFQIAKLLKKENLYAIAYNEYGNIFLLSTQFDKALENYKKSLEIFKKLKSTQQSSSVLNNIGNIYFYIGNYHDAVSYYENSLELKKELANNESIAKTLNNIASAYTRLGLYKLALENFLEALKYREDINKQEDIATTLMNIGGLYMQIKDYKNAEEFLNSAYKIYSQSSNKINMAYILTNMSIIYRNEKKYEKSEEILKKAISVKKQIGYEVDIANDYFNLGLTYYLWNKFDEAKSIFQKTLNLAKNINDENSLCYSKIYLSKLASSSQEAEKLLFSALKQAKEQDNKNELLLIYQYLYELYEKENACVKSYDFFKKYIAIKDDIESDKTDRELIQLQKKYDIEKKNKENELLKKENKLLKEKVEAQKKLNQAQQTIRIQKKKIELISRELSTKIERNLIGNSDAIKEVLKLAMTCASYKDVSVLITGENGTGKEIIARIIHYASERKNNMFFPVNCAAVPESLLESEFFGYSKGAFTGANKNKEGIFELANRGTLFLDEIADMPFILQGKLLRVLEDKKVTRVGSNKANSIDVRIISATNKDIQKLVRQNKFRIDFFHRINTITINIPPLRERPSDIKPILFYYVEYFSKIFNKPTPKIENSLINFLSEYDFPGNVRELKNLVERAIILSTNNILTKEDFPIKEKTQKNFTKNTSSEKETIEKMLWENNFNQTKTAQQLGISRYTLIRKMKKYGISVKRNLK